MSDGEQMVEVLEHQFRCKCGAIKSFETEWLSELPVSYDCDACEAPVYPWRVMAETVVNDIGIEAPPYLTWDDVHELILHCDAALLRKRLLKRSPEPRGFGVLFTVAMTISFVVTLLFTTGVLQR